MNYSPKYNILMLNDKVLDFNRNKYIMGIINVTPDSFFDGGKYLNLDDVIYRIEEVIKQGADIIDIGGESTKPGSKQVSLEEELNRVIPVIRRVSKEFDTLISVDTTKAEVAKEALENGACMINDISGLNFEPDIANYVAQHNAAIVLMHTTSRPIDMQEKIEYTSLIDNIMEYLDNSISKALDKGVDKSKIIIDPGIGFGKTFENNLQIIKELKKFEKLKFPILIGTSRKSFIGKIMERINMDERLIGSVITSVISALNGASILRVHDVAETKQALETISCINKSMI